MAHKNPDKMHSVFVLATQRLTALRVQGEALCRGRGFLVSGAALGL